MDVPQYDPNLIKVAGGSMTPQELQALRQAEATPVPPPRTTRRVEPSWSDSILQSIRSGVIKLTEQIPGNDLYRNRVRAEQWYNRPRSRIDSQDLRYYNDILKGLALGKNNR